MLVGWVLDLESRMRGGFLYLEIWRDALATSCSQRRPQLWLLGHSCAARRRITMPGHHEEARHIELYASGRSCKAMAMKGVPTVYNSTSPSIV